MATIVLVENLPRLQRLLERLGLEVHPPGTNIDGLRVGTKIAEGPNALRLTSPFPVHQARRILHALAYPLAPDGIPKAPDAKLRRLFAQIAEAPNMDGSGELHDPETPPLEVLEPALDVHQVMEVAWVEHRLALMTTDLRNAAHHLHRFTDAMTAHLTLENEHILPAYVAMPPPGDYERGGAPAIFETEHRRILDRLAGFSRFIKDLIDSGVDGDPARLACLHLLDRQKVFTDLLEHHDQRERAFLYPYLERILPEANKRDLVDRFLDLNL